MTFWSSQTIKKNTRIVQPFCHNRVSESSYTLSVGDEIFITSNLEDKFEKARSIKLRDDEVCYIPPGQFAYLITAEKVFIPNNVIAFISMKFKTKAEGLINVSGFHVDPGYQGNIIFAVYNAGVKNIPIKKGYEIFLIWFANLDERDSIPRINKKPFYEIPQDILNNAQSAETIKNLSDRIRILEKDIERHNTKHGMFVAVLIPVNIAIYAELYKNYSSENIPENVKCSAYFIGIVLLVGFLLYLYRKPLLRFWRGS